VRLRQSDQTQAAGPNDFFSIRARRSFDLSSVRLSISKTGTDSDPLAVQMDAQLFPLHKDVVFPTTSQESNPK
jgi:hypothetical protein